ncbi:helix-turn-helix domain-containing protein [Streptomyces sp. NBC_01800]|uniref:helix-turn-helix domain-containing protein n=1 Tax=Streptomyces sp. NBC_01800 TaxID=2975945 RepID=UPI003FA3AFCE
MGTAAVAGRLSAVVSTVGVVVRHNWVRGWFIVLTEAHRAFRFTLDPTRVQEEALLRQAGSARGAFKHAG